MHSHRSHRVVCCASWPGCHRPRGPLCNMPRGHTLSERALRALGNSRFGFPPLGWASVLAPVLRESSESKNKPSGGLRFDLITQNVFRKNFKNGHTCAEVTGRADPCASCPGGHTPDPLCNNMCPYSRLTPKGPDKFPITNTKFKASNRLLSQTYLSSIPCCVLLQTTPSSE